MSTRIVRYTLEPGFVFSMNDGQRHYIDAVKLAALYGVRLDECYVVHPGGHIPIHLWHLPRLVPRTNGIYRVPTGPSHQERGRLMEHVRR